MARVYRAPLAKMTTLGVGGLAEIWEIETPADLAEALAEPYYILGAGSNILANDRDFDRHVVKLSPRFNDIASFDGRTALWLGAATPLPGLVRRATQLGLSGLEGLLGIPAVLGGAIAMNAGTRFGEIGDCIEEVELWVDGQLVRLSASECKFSYRKAELPTDAVVLRAKLSLQQSSPQDVAAKLHRVDAARQGQPKRKSAGCAFKNPPNDSAGRLIDTAGLKGLRVGNAMVSYEHANFIVNLGGATSEDIVTLIKRIQETLEHPLNIEWRTWGFSSPSPHSSQEAVDVA